MATSATPVQIINPTTGASYVPGSTPAGSDNIATSQVSVGTSATLIAAARPGRKGITITNITGTQQIFIGNTGVAANTGALIPAAVAGSQTIPSSAAVYGIAVTLAQTVSVLETY